MKNIFNLSWLFIILIVSYSGKAWAQCPTNIGFEQNSFNQWNGFTGTCCPVNAFTPGIVGGRHTITSVLSGNDPIINVIPQLCPFPGFGQYSVRY
ncbi:MAG: hypothetical protein EBS07_12860 [Sphingobacteriia bacterium]|nr:hypothetical protein [Sphingobacteriia bacterium]